MEGIVTAREGEGQQQQRNQSPKAVTSPHPQLLVYFRSQIPSSGGFHTTATECSSLGLAPFT